MLLYSSRPCNAALNNNVVHANIGLDSLRLIFHQNDISIKGHPTQMLGRAPLPPSQRILPGLRPISTPTLEDLPCPTPHNIFYARFQPAKVR